jgi:hypothetical protein
MMTDEIVTENRGKVIDFTERRKKAPEPDPTMMAQITIYDNGDGTLWLADSLYAKEQFNWLLAKVAEVSAAVVREKADRTGEM